MNSAGDFKSSANILVLSITVFFFIGCAPKETININYLNQEPPGMEAKTFAPGIVSSGLSEHSSPAFSPDGRVMLWTVMDTIYHGKLLEVTWNNGEWSKPAKPSFADSVADDYYASFSPDGKKLFFSSRRKVPIGYPEGRDLRIWEVDRFAEGWGIPVPLDTLVSPGQDFAHSVSANGNIYFSSVRSGNTNMNIRHSARSGSRYAEPLLLPFSINSVQYEDGPFISPDETYLIFESQRPESINCGLDLYISFRNEKGQWGLPINMGPKVNTEFSERFARLSPDGKYLFFGSTRNKTWGFDIFWISAKVIEELRSTQTKKQNIPEPLGSQILEALDKNDVGHSSVLLKQWLEHYPESPGATVLYISNLRKEKRYIEVEQFLSGKPQIAKSNAGIIMETAIVKIGLDKNKEADSLLATLLLPGDDLRERYLYLSQALLEMGKLNASDAYFNKAMSVSPAGSRYYDRAREMVRLGEKDRAFALLNKAAGFGGTDIRKEYEADASLVSLKTDVRWKVLMKMMK